MKKWMKNEWLCRTANICATVSNLLLLALPPLSSSGIDLALPVKYLVLVAAGLSSIASGLHLHRSAEEKLISVTDPAEKRELEKRSFAGLFLLCWGAILLAFALLSLENLGKWTPEN